MTADRQDRDHRIVRVVRWFRRRRMRRFERTFAITAATRVLDVGGTAMNWDYLSVRPWLVILNTGRERRDAQGIEWVAGDGCALPFPDGAFDIVFSNSVIEHVGSPDQQARFAREIARVGQALLGADAESLVSRGTPSADPVSALAAPARARLNCAALDHLAMGAQARAGPPQFLCGALSQRYSSAGAGRNEKAFCRGRADPRALCGGHEIAGGSAGGSLRFVTGDAVADGGVADEPSSRSDIRRRTRPFERNLGCGEVAVRPCHSYGTYGATREGAVKNGGEGEIRTPGTREGSTVFETAAIDHSATSPRR